MANVPQPKPTNTVITLQPGLRPERPRPQQAAPATVTPLPPRKKKRYILE